jgi:hypothetical protein
VLGFFPKTTSREGVSFGMTTLDMPITWMPSSSLRLDAKNPRLFLEDDLSDIDLIRILWREFAVDEVALSIAANGYFVHEPLFVAFEDDNYVVVEGNRRLAAVRLLLDSQLQDEINAELPPISSERMEELQNLPVVECTRREVWRYLGFKHVNGSQTWQSYAKAQYVAWLRNELNIPLDNIARSIGDRHWTVRRLYRGLMVLRQAENLGVFVLKDRWKVHFSFSHLYTGLGYPNIQAFLGINDVNSFVVNPVREGFVTNLADLLLWLYGRQSSGIEPLIKSQNPDLRTLESVIGSASGLAALKQGLPLRVAHDISLGDERIFKGHLIEARYRLQEARGKQLTGDTGELENLRIAEDILDLADYLVEDMRQKRRKDRSARRSGPRTTT